MPGITVWEMNSFVGSGICIEYRRATSMYDPLGCQMPAVIVDGVRIEDPSLYLEALPVSDIESMEVVPLSEARTRYGLGTGYGAPWPSRPAGPPTSKGSGANSMLSSSVAYDWTPGTERHPSVRVFLGAALGNTAGLLLAPMAGGNCFDWFELNREIREVECGGVEMALAHLRGLALPALGAGLDARLFRATDVSQGRTRIAAAVATSALGLGLGVMVTSRGSGGSDFRVQEIVGGTLVGFVAPAPHRPAGRLKHPPAPRPAPSAPASLTRPRATSGRFPLRSNIGAEPVNDNGTLYGIN